MTLEEINQAFMQEMMSDDGSAATGLGTKKTHYTAAEDKPAAIEPDSRTVDLTSAPSALASENTETTPVTAKPGPAKVEAPSALPPFRFTEPPVGVPVLPDDHTSIITETITDSTVLTDSTPAFTFDSDVGHDADPGYERPEITREIWMAGHPDDSFEPTATDAVTNTSASEIPVPSAHSPSETAIPQTTVIPLRRGETKPGKKGIRLMSIVSDVFFYAAILIIFIQILTSDGTDGAPKMIFNHSFFTVMGDSRQGAIPRGSFIIVRKTDPSRLNIGDNITFMRDSSTSVTHQIIEIYEDFQGSGFRGFQTQGVNNPNPDPSLVHESGVLGKVVLVLPVIGAVVAYLNTNVILLVVIFVLCVVLSFSLRGLFTKPRKDQMLEGNA